MGGENFTDEELEGLSEEERAALKDEDDDDQSKAENQSKDDGDKGDLDSKPDGDDDGKGTSDDAGSDDGKSTGDDGNQNKDDSTDEGKSSVDEPSATASTQVIPPFQLNIGTDKTLEGIEAELEALDEKFEEGDIPLKEYNAQRDVLNQSKFRLEMYDDINKQVASQAVETRWKQSQEDFFTENANYRENSILNAAFVHAVNTLLATDDGKRLTDRQILLKAKENVEQSLGIVTGKNEDKEKDKGDAGKAALEAAKEKEAQKGKDGVSLRDIPKSQQEDSGDKFAYLDNLEGEAFENAIAALSESERKAYARRG